MWSSEEETSLFFFDSSSEEDCLAAFHDIRGPIDNSMLSAGELLSDVDTLEEFALVPENMATFGETTSSDRDDQTSHEARVSVADIARLSDEKLEKMSIRELNKFLRRITDDGLIQTFRKRRRVLKNRKYSRKFRQKGSERKSTIVTENRALELEILQAKEELRKVTKERDAYKQKYEWLKSTVTNG